MIDSGTSAVPKAGNRHLLGCHGAREKGGFIERVGARVPKFGRAPRFENMVVGAPMDAVLLQQYLKFVHQIAYAIGPGDKARDDRQGIGLGANPS
ncbi:hypothetical protein BSL82_05220 [Tardibacter chloracetimidivorans]|uniref:Uncharacterized protein n=1 Tax=Tardibacter chloracetimidivorans TaxID=1921510 RepID=A0A1L3ZT22_9SPHN|nr:hypothetical protein [Tardibacter chloracetimidivorans]API58786.1 hypothetical protein BSL82_05220 [Tardibacter chloracetimidivorans]